MNAYSVLAGNYDILTRDVDYVKWTDYYVRHFGKNRREVKIVLDLACGTGSVSCLLSQKGYDVIGIDKSAEMLSTAYQKAAGMENPPMFLNQDMRRIDLYGTVDAVVCGLDSVNYVKPKDLADVLRRVRLFLAPGGIFIFDINTAEKFNAIDNQVFIDEDGGVYCVWRANFDRKKNICKYYMDIFELDGENYKRGYEEHTEYAYSSDTLYKMLKDSGFNTVKTYGELKFTKPVPSEHRIFITAK